MEKPEYLNERHWILEYTSLLYRYHWCLMGRHPYRNCPDPCNNPRTCDRPGVSEYSPCVSTYSNSAPFAFKSPRRSKYRIYHDTTARRLRDYKYNYRLRKIYTG